jgi:hypothetical protein
MTISGRRAYIDRSSPYHVRGKAPKPQRSLVVFADILGFKQDMIAAIRAKKGTTELRRLRRCLDKAYDRLGSQLTDQEGTRMWDVKTFTDNLVLGLPIVLDNLDGESELGFILSAMTYFQYEMIRGGYFLRGGISMGDLYMDLDIVWGAGLLHAYSLESRGHGPPRLLLGTLVGDDSDRTLLSHVFYQLAHYADPSISPHQHELLIDRRDNGVFLDYLAAVFNEEDNIGMIAPNMTEVRRHKQLVEKRLRKFRKTAGIRLPKKIADVRKKYEWVASYHNFHCDEAGIPREKIDSRLYSSRTSRFYRFSSLFPSRQHLVELFPWVEKGRSL